MYALTPTKLSYLLLLQLLSISAFAQNDSWNLVPYNQTSYFENSQSGEVLSMKNDFATIGSVTDYFSVNREQMVNEFDTCADSLWVSNYDPNPQANFRGWGNNTFELNILAKNEVFWLDLQGDVGSWFWFGTNYLSRLDNISTVQVFGTTDSVREYSIYKNDSTTVAGVIHLTKDHGLINFNSFKYFDGESTDSVGVWALVGFSDSTQAQGFQLPEKVDYFPYSIGDSMLLKHSSHRNLGPNNWEFFADFISFKINAIDTNLLTISGVGDRYDSLGFYISTDNNFSFTFTLLEEMLNHPYSVPHYALITQNTPFNGNVASYPYWTNEGNGVVIANLGGYELNPCASVIDGLAYHQNFHSDYGFLDSYSSSFGGPPVSYETMAYHGQDDTYGTWPTLLSAPEVENKTMAFAAFPNPANDRINIQMEAVGFAELLITDLSGRVMHQLPIQSATSVDVSQYAPGVYFFSLIQDDERMDQKVIVQH